MSEKCQSSTPSTLFRGTRRDVRAPSIVTLERLLLRVTMMDLKRTAALLRPHSLTLPQFFALLTVERGGEEGCTMSELAEGTLQTPSSLTGIIGRLAGRSLCVRSRDPRDRRVVRVHLTPQGKEVLTKVREARRAELSQSLGEASPTDMIAPLRELLEGLARLAYPNDYYPPGFLL
ncbi:MAG: MarR family winged helix-turn-helix transcriptional regulator [Anaerolineae bacterium]